MQCRGLLLGLRQQQEGVLLVGELGGSGVNEGVPAARDGQPGYLGRPRAYGLAGNHAPLIAAAQRHPVRAPDDVGGVRGLLEEGRPDRLERGLGADHRDEPEALGLVVAGEGVGGGREATGRDGVESLARTRYGVLGVYGVGCEHVESPFVVRIGYDARGSASPAWCWAEGVSPSAPSA